MLLLVSDREPVLEQAYAGAHQHAFEFRHRSVELLVLLGSAETHYAFDSGAVVPAAVEQDDLAGRRKYGTFPESTTPAFAIVGSGQGDYRQTREFSRCVTRFMALPLPAASRPLNRITTFSRASTTQSCSLTSSACSRKSWLK